MISPRNIEFVTPERYWKMSWRSIVARKVVSTDSFNYKMSVRSLGGLI